MKIHRLSGLDKGFLLLEGPSQPFHQCSLAELDVSALPGGYSFEAIRDTLAERVRALPEFRAKLADSRLNLGTPVWVEDADFSIANHVRRMQVPDPGGPRELSAIAADLAATPMDRSRPLWDITVLEGISGKAPDENGRIALFIRTHHIFADGVSSGNMWAQLYADGDVATPAQAEGFGMVDKRRIVLGGLAQFLGRPWFLVRTVLPESIVGIIRTLRRRGQGQVMSSLFVAPPTPFNGDVSEQRDVAFAHLELSDVLAVKNKFGVKVNDVLAAIASGALRRYLAMEGALPTRSLIAVMPISIYDESRDSRNQFSPMIASMHTDAEDPVDRLKAIAEASSIAKDHSSAIGYTLLLDWTQFAPSILKTIVRLFRRSGIGKRQPIFNLSFSNVRGTQERILGAPIISNYPFGPVLTGVGLNITVSTLNDSVDIGFVACPRLLPNVWDLADGATIALKELLDA